MGHRVRIDERPGEGDAKTYVVVDDTTGLRVHPGGWDTRADAEAAARDLGKEIVS